MLNDPTKLLFSNWVIKTITQKFMLFQNEISFLHEISLRFSLHLYIVHVEFSSPLKFI